ncbi:MAG TPA: PHP domain-containing protein, partial [Acidimicrobiia bacterium]
RVFGEMLWRLADMVRAGETRRSFRAKAFQRAVWALDHLPPDLRFDKEKALAISGIGPGVLSLIEEYLNRGRLTELETLERRLPSEAPHLRRLPRMTPKILTELKAAIGVETRADLRVAIESDSLGSISGVGPATMALWAEILALQPRDSTIVPSHSGWVIASMLARHISSHTGCWIDIAGDVRRLEEWVGGVDLVATGGSVDALADFLLDSAVLGDAEREDDRVTGRAHTGLPVDILWAPPDVAGTALAQMTGPQAHLDHLSLDPYPTENELYEASGFPLIPAPARVLPIDVGSRVVLRQDLRGDLHLHTEDSPDGHLSIDALLNAAVAESYDYVLITDHTQGLRFGGLDEQAMLQQAAAIERMRPRFPQIVVLHGAELNIAVDGSLDMDDDTLSILDFAVAGLHSHFGLDEHAQTRRLETAMAHPAVRVLAHPFGRRIGIRPAIDVDMETVIEASLRHGVALETNGHRDRLDLGADWLEIAAERGALFTANSDAHRREEIGNVANAVGTLQRAGIDAERVVNTWDVDRLLAWIGDDHTNRRVTKTV